MLKYKTLRKLMGDRKATVGMKLGYSYGSLIDAMVKKLRPPSITTSQDNSGLTRMLIGRRFDYFISSSEKGAYLIESLSIASDDIVIAKFEDMPPGNKRYVLCSKKVSDKMIDKLNAMILDMLR